MGDVVNHVFGTGEVTGIATAADSTSARRPANSRLNHALILSAYGIELRSWDAALSDIFDELIGTPK